MELLELSADEQLWQEVQINLTQLQQELETADIRQLLSDPHDKKGALLTITAEVDNADSQYWAYMLLKMYWRWGKSHDYQLDVVEISEGNEGGVKYATLEITASCAYGYLKSETGTHQLQQISPFDVTNSLRTSLPNVEVIPILGESVEWEIPEKDLQITRWQCNSRNINHSEIWVKVLHIPSGISVFCDQERSQMQNKEKALAILKSKLLAMPTAGYAYALAQGVQQVDEIQPRLIKFLSNKLIREYILHPYTKVKDLRTNVETSAATEVLDGKIDLFIKAYLQQPSQTTLVDKEALDNSK